ncbi:MAG TPA: hypothetical protein VGL34_25030 [Steroidobacteraceae bacterium]|jgi:hypothetical protein
MKPVEFAEQTLVLAEDQPEYQPLPVHIAKNGTVTSCWELSADDLVKIVHTKKIWFQQLTFGQALQPQLPSIDKPDQLTFRNRG